MQAHHTHAQALAAAAVMPRHPILTHLNDSDKTGTCDIPDGAELSTGPHHTLGRSQAGPRVGWGADQAAGMEAAGGRLAEQERAALHNTIAVCCYSNSAPKS